MLIKEEECISCQLCFDYCPTGAIKLSTEHDSVFISQEDCLECGVCKHVAICPTDALVESENIGQYPRVISSLFSNPNTTHKSTLVPGRGTEECKTNDVRGRIKVGELGVLIEFGRPGIGCTFSDISIMTRQLKKYGVTIEQANPLTALMDEKSGEFPSEIMDQRVLSVIIELNINTRDLKLIFQIIKTVSSTVNTVFSVSILSRIEKERSLKIVDELNEIGFKTRPNAKINLGLGRPLSNE